jgi:hypothetical protein
VKELEFERSVCASVYACTPVKLHRVSALGFQFLSPVFARRSADCGVDLIDLTCVFVVRVRVCRRESIMNATELTNGWW